MYKAVFVALMGLFLVSVQASSAQPRVQTEGACPLPPEGKTDKYLNWDALLCSAVRRPLPQETEPFLEWLKQPNVCAPDGKPKGIRSNQPCAVIFQGLQKGSVPSEKLPPMIITKIYRIVVTGDGNVTSILLVNPDNQVKQVNADKFGELVAAGYRRATPKTDPKTHKVSYLLNLDSSCDSAKDKDSCGYYKNVFGLSIPLNSTEHALSDFAVSQVFTFGLKLEEDLELFFKSTEQYETARRARVLH